MSNRPFTVVLIVPTGVGASIGGYAGDALPVAKAIAQVCDTLITHPNVLNGAQLYWPIPNALYVEGYGLDQFAAGNWGLSPVRHNRVGLILDGAIEADLQLRHLQAVDAVRATLGLTLTDYVVTDAPLNVQLQIADSGASWGTIGNPDSLLRAADALIHRGGANAIAVVARFPDTEDSIALENYRLGQGVDPLAGAEAVISHLIVKTFQIPCAHAPALSPLPLNPHISPRSAAEELGYTFLPCVLVGLSKAPQFITNIQESITPSLSSIPKTSPKNRINGRQDAYPTVIYGDVSSTVWSNQVDSVIIPATACGGSAILSLSQFRDVQIIAVTENETQMKVTPEKLGIKAIQVNSYLDAIGVLVAQRAGINPSALRPEISPSRHLP